MLKYHIQTIELASAQAAISFDNVPQNFTDLVIKISSRSTGSAAGINLRFNNDSSTLYDSRKLFGSGSLVQGITYNTQPAIYLWEQTQSTYTANTFSNIEAYVSNYTAGTHKPVSCDGVSENNATTSGQNIIAGVYRSTNPINSVLLIDGGFNFAAGTSVSLYGVKRGSDGIVNLQPAYGGEITTSGGYTIHTFNSSGTFTTTMPLECEYLVIAGGGGSGGYYSGGGGAGGYRSSVVGEMSGREGAAEAKLNVPIFSSYSILVGSGGAGGTNAEQGLPGSNSTFSTITSIGGGKALGDGTSNAGGSGGGGGPSSFSSPELRIGGTGTNGQGFNGGTNTVTNSATGGGGGAGSAGGVPSGSTGGNGGNGVTSSITGSAVARAGGGGGGSDPGPAGTATAGGGAGSSNVQALPGQPNTGGGGGGRYDPPPVGSRFGQPGGSGVVIIRYLTP
jgi:hypothetical protein